MRTVNAIRIHSDLAGVFSLASDVEHWPAILPHYRWVKVLRRDGDRSVVEMAARRGIIPVKWVSVQHVCPRESRIVYKHVSGPTAGMWVEWSFTRAHDGVEVCIVHDLTLDIPIVSCRVGKLIVGEFFVKDIAEKTLAHIKARAEGDHHGR